MCRNVWNMPESAGISPFYVQVNASGLIGCRDNAALLPEAWL